jgi:hypothetical protein
MDKRPNGSTRLQTKRMAKRARICKEEEENRLLSEAIQTYWVVHAAMPEALSRLMESYLVPGNPQPPPLRWILRSEQIESDRGTWVRHYDITLIEHLQLSGSLGSSIVIVFVV